MADPSGQVTTKQKEASPHNVGSKENRLHQYLDAHLPPLMMDMIYWKSIQRSSVTLIVSLLVVHFLSTYRPHVVLAGLLFSLIIIGFVLKASLFMVKGTQSTDINNPIVSFPDLSAYEKYLSTTNLDEYIAKPLGCLLKNINLVISIKDNAFSIKVAFVTYIIYLFNGFCNFDTLVFISLLVSFTVPLLYSTYQNSIDSLLSKLYAAVVDFFNKFDEKLPPSFKENLSRIGLYPSTTKDKTS